MGGVSIFLKEGESTIMSKLSSTRGDLIEEGRVSDFREFQKKVRRSRSEKISFGGEISQI